MAVKASASPCSSAGTRARKGRPPGEPDALGQSPSVPISWLIAFDVLNVRNQTIYRIVRAFEAVTDPLLRPIRRFLPSLGGIDISPIILIILLQALKILVDGLLVPYAYGAVY